MNVVAILTALESGEDKDWEFKAAKGGLPKAVWETYSAMANTDGGLIVLGIVQRDGRFVVEGVSNPDKLKRDFWNSFNNRSCTNLNILSNDHVTVDWIDSKPLLTIRIPRAERRRRPIYVGQNPVAFYSSVYLNQSPTKRLRRTVYWAWAYKRRSLALDTRGDCNDVDGRRDRD